jgi:uncharacterized protein
MVPGVGETMRVNGTARLSTDPVLRESFAMADKVPACVIVITVSEIYTQCQKALVRSRLWDASIQIERHELPSVGQMLQKITRGAFDGRAYDDEYPERMKRTIY